MILRYSLILTFQIFSKKTYKNYYKPFTNTTGLIWIVSIQESSTSGLELHSQTFWYKRKVTFLFLTT